ncbi:hypothetical protein lerEdw1_014026 [Lerista edwardsae]|nr:hypothetical protein lerEdw1_014026 [Lerista edwardsae]
MVTQKGWRRVTTVMVESGVLGEDAIRKPGGFVLSDVMMLSRLCSPVLRSLARLRPDMTLEDGVPRAVQEWEHSSNFERMIFYEMAEKFMEFEAEEEQQIQKMKLLASCSQFQAPAPKATKPPASPVPESGQQQVYIPKKSASKSRQPRRRQRRPPSTSAPGAPREIPAEAVHQYAEIMEGLDTSWEEEEDEKKEQGESGVPQDQEDRVFPDPSLLPYIDQLCDDEEFVCKVEAIIHPQFMADLLSPEKNQDPLDLVEELVEELNLTPSQLIEKRLLALSEEEREPSVCPTSHSDSTPSQSEEEDEVIGSGKGEDASCQAMKRPSPNKGIRSSQTELPTQFLSSPLAPPLHQRLRERHLPPKGGRPATSLFPQKCSSHDPQEGGMLPSLKNKDEAESLNTQEQDKAGGHLGQLNGDPPHAQWLRLEATTSITGKNSLNGNLTSQGDPKAGPGFQKPHTTKYSKEADNQEANVKGQLEVPRTTEQDGRAVKAQFQNGSQIVWKSLESALSSCGKQGGVQQWRVKCLKKAQVMGEGPGEDPRWTDHASQDTNYMLLADTVTQEGTLKLTMNRQEEQNIDCAEKATGQSLDRGSRGSEDTSGSIQLHSQSRGMACQWDNLLKQAGQELAQPECNKQDGCQREGFKDPNPWKGPNSATGATETHFGSTSLCGQSLKRQGSPTLVPAEPGKPFDGHETKAQPQMKAPIGWESAKAAVVTANSPVRSVRLFADRLALPKQSASARQDGQQPLVLDVNYPSLKPHVEPSCASGKQLTDSSSVGVLESQLPSIASEHPPYFTCVVLEPSSSSTQKGPGRSQESERPLAEQGEVTPWMGSSSAGKQTLKPTLNPSGYVSTFETEGGSCGPSGDHMPEPPSPGKAIATLPPPPGAQGCSSSHENDESKPRFESSDPPSSKVHGGTSSSKSDTKSLAEVEEGGLLEAVAKTSILLPELPGGCPKDSGKYGAQGEADEEEEDEELTTFSSLLASKLSLSPHSGHILPPREQRDTSLSSLTETGKQGAKTRHSPRGQVFQDSIVLLSKNVDANQTVYRSHKRKGGSSGTRRSKRLRNQ